MSYIIDLLRGTIQPMPDRISLERYVQESSFVTRYLSRVVKDKAPGRVEESVADAAGSCTGEIPAVAI